MENSNADAASIISLSSKKGVETSLLYKLIVFFL